MTDKLPKPSSVSVYRLIYVISVVAVLVGLGALFVSEYDRREEVSDSENRRLASWPALSEEMLLSGEYFKAIELYVADHFPWRDQMTDLAMMIRSNTGFSTGERIVRVQGAENGFEDIGAWAQLPADRTSESDKEPDPDVSVTSIKDETVDLPNESSMPSVVETVIQVPSPLKFENQVDSVTELTVTPAQSSASWQANPKADVVESDSSLQSEPTATRSSTDETKHQGATTDVGPSEPLVPSQIASDAKPSGAIRTTEHHPQTKMQPIAQISEPVSEALALSQQDSPQPSSQASLFFSLENGVGPIALTGVAESTVEADAVSKTVQTNLKSPDELMVEKVAEPSKNVPHSSTVAMWQDTARVKAIDQHQPVVEASGMNHSLDAGSIYRPIHQSKQALIDRVDLQLSEPVTKRVGNDQPEVVQERNQTVRLDGDDPMPRQQGAGNQRPRQDSEITLVAANNTSPRETPEVREALALDRASTSRDASSTQSIDVNQPILVNETAEKIGDNKDLADKAHDQANPRGLVTSVQRAGTAVMLPPAPPVAAHAKEDMPKPAMGENTDQPLRREDTSLAPAKQTQASAAKPNQDKVLTSATSRASTRPEPLVQADPALTGSAANSTRIGPPESKASTQLEVTKPRSSEKQTEPKPRSTSEPQPKVKPKPKPISKSKPVPARVSNGVLIHDGQALFMFGGSEKSAKRFAQAINAWPKLVEKNRLKKAKGNKAQGPLTYTLVVTPTSSHFYLPESARQRSRSEADNLSAMHDALDPGVKFADVLSEMQGHEDEPMFYRSDHHWTGLGAYYAYRAWAKANGIKPYELGAFDKRTAKGVRGSFWNLTRAPELRGADKTSDYYVPTMVSYDSKSYYGDQQQSPGPFPFFAEKNRGYMVFLGGDNPLMVADTTANTGRTALVVKNSYGNAFAPYLLPHFDRVVVVDYRYLSRNIHEIIDTFGVTDVVFVNATIIANSGAHQTRLKQVAQGSSKAWLTEAQKRKQREQEQAKQASGGTP